MKDIIESRYDLRPGDLMFGPIKGAVGLGVGMAQLLLAIAEPGLIWDQGVEEWWEVRHCGIIVEAGVRPLPSAVGSIYSRAPRLVQAMPGGIEEIELGSDKWNSDYIYLRPAYDPGEPFEAGYQYRSQGFKVGRAARSYVGRPYDFATYGAIPLYRRGIRTERIKRIISDTSAMMCSRTVDAALCEAGWHLFDDGRLPGNVTPSELYRRVREMPLDAMFRPTQKALKL